MLDSTQKFYLGFIYSTSEIVLLGQKYCFCYIFVNFTVCSLEMTFVFLFSLPPTANLKNVGVCVCVCVGVTDSLLRFVTLSSHIKGSARSGPLRGFKTHSQGGL